MKMHIRFSCTTFDLTFQKQAGSTSVDNFLVIYENLYAIVMYDVSAAPFRHRQVPDLLTGPLRQMRNHNHFSGIVILPHIQRVIECRRIDHERCVTIISTFVQEQTLLTFRKPRWKVKLKFQLLTTPRMNSYA